MILIDTHCHIYLKEFDYDRREVIDKGRAEGIERICMPAIDSTTHDKMLFTEDKYSGICFSMMGLHPCSVKTNYLEELMIAKNYLEQRRFYAVGEIGLDFYWDLSFTKEQYVVFQTQIEWALHSNIPVVIHSRNSMDECIKVISEHQKGNLKGIFHCFTGSVEQAKKIVDLGFYLGIGGVLTYKKSGLDEVVQKIHLSHIVLETDAPYLAPVPFRGKRNECGYIKYVAEKLAEILQLSTEEIGKLTSANAEKIFGVENGDV